MGSGEVLSRSLSGSKQIDTAQRVSAQPILTGDQQADELE